MGPVNCISIIIFMHESMQLQCMEKMGFRSIFAQGRAHHQLLNSSSIKSDCPWHWQFWHLIFFYIYYYTIVVFISNVLFEVDSRPPLPKVDEII